MPFSAPKVKALGVLIKSRTGAKFYSKYYTNHLNQDYSKTQFDVKTDIGKQKFQKALEQKCMKINISSKMDAQRTQIFSVAGFTVLFKVIDDLIIFLVCEQQQNIVLMQNAINCIGKVLLLITTERYQKKTIQDNLDSIIISVDEVFDDGIILCLDQNQVYDRLKMREGGERREPVTTSTAQNKQAQQSTSAFNSFFGFAKNTLQKTLNLG